MSMSEILKTLYQSIESSEYGADEFFYSAKYSPLTVPGVGTVEVLKESYLGGEGQGEAAKAIMKIVTEDGSTFFAQKHGYYSSYDGTTWDGDIYEVEPVEVMVTQYRRK